MSQSVIARATVADFEQFLRVFTSRGAEHRSAFGSRGSSLYRGKEDPNEVWAVFDWDHDAYRDFLGNDATKEIMAAAGLQGPPESLFLEQVTELPA